MNHQLMNYQTLIQIDQMINGYGSNYPFNINEKGKYTQHQITLYRSNYCHTETNQKQETVSGGSIVSIVLL